MADIGNIVSTDREIDIVHPGNKEPLGIKVKVVHIDDPRMKKLKRRITDDRLRLEQKGKNFKADDIDENKNALLFTGMTGWTWGQDESGEQQTFEGEVPEFSRRNVLIVFEKLPWFADQINEAISDTESFFKTSKSN